jgi:hypothetical protein
LLLKYLRRRTATFAANSLENYQICAAGILCFCPLSLWERAGVREARWPGLSMLEIMREFLFSKKLRAFHSSSTVV